MLYVFVFVEYILSQLYCDITQTFYDSFHHN
jgi:hypothetical protein